MIFDDLRHGESVFLDANPMVYHFSRDPAFGANSTILVKRIESGELTAYTSTHVLSETAHHLMTVEAATLFGWSSKIVTRLKQQPANIQNLVAFRQAIDQVPKLGVKILVVGDGLVSTAAHLSQQYGLLSNDALIVAVMQAHGITNIASNDPDFDRVPGITRFAPA